MTRLPTDLSGKELVKIPSKIGFVFQRQQGSHMVLRRESPSARVVVPNYQICVLGPFGQFSMKQELQSNDSSNFGDRLTRGPKTTFLLQALTTNH